MHKESLVGWSSVDAVMGARSRLSFPFNKGTARNAMASKDISNKTNVSGVTMDFEILVEQNLLNASNLLPSTVMVGSDELLPGLKSERLPNSIQAGDISLLPTKELFIERVSLNLSSDILAAVREDCKRFRSEKYGRT